MARGARARGHSRAIVAPVGRLEDIVDRNKHPRRHRKMKFPYGIAVAGVVLAILVLAMFTDLAGSKQPPPAPPDRTHVDGVQLRRLPAPPKGTGSPGGSLAHDAGHD